MSEDQTVDHGFAGWTSRQKLVLALCCIAVVLDGFDTQVIGFAAPALLADWGVTKADLAPALAMGLIGMTVGAAVAGWLGDRLGRKIVIVGSVLVFGALTAATAMVSNVIELAALRFLAGLGLGGALPNVAALVAEFAPARLRSLAVSITIVCVPVGGVIGGLFAAPLLPRVGWHWFFLTAGALPVLVGLVLALLLPESPQFLEKRRGVRLNDRTDTDGPVAGLLPRSTAAMCRDAVRAHPHLVSDTIALWAAFFVALFCNYLYFNWLPIMLSEVDLGVSQSSLGLLFYNLGGVVSGVGVTTQIARFGSRRPMIGLATLGMISALIPILFPLGGLAHAGWLLPFLFAQGFCVAGLQALLFALAVNIFPVEIRATGIGSAGSVGRIGGVIGSGIGAVLLGAFGAHGFFFAIMISMVVAAVAILVIRRHVTA